MVGKKGFFSSLMDERRSYKKTNGILHLNDLNATVYGITVLADRYLPRPAEAGKRPTGKGFNPGVMGESLLSSHPLNDAGFTGEP